jgi:uncharacterized protein
MKRLSHACCILLAATNAGAAQPSFDCGRAAAGVEAMLCQDEQLASLDRELDRLYRLARDGSYATANGRDELKATQSRWIERRDACGEGPAQRWCLRDLYVSRIAELRVYYADARSEDALGISRGPLVLACQGFDSLIGLTFVGQSQDLALIEWRNTHAYVLGRERGGPGITYTGGSGDEYAALWVNGDDAQLLLADRPAMDCKIEPPG